MTIATSLGPKVDPGRDDPGLQAMQLFQQVQTTAAVDLGQVELNMRFLVILESDKP